MLENIYILLIIALATSSISMTISKATIFEATRDWIKTKNAWISDLVHCPYCTSHWVGFAFVVYIQPEILPQKTLLNIVLSTFVVVTLSSVFSGLIFKSIDLMVEYEGEYNEEE